MLAGGRNSRCNSLDYFLLGFFLCARFFLVTPHPTWDIALALVPPGPYVARDGTAGRRRRPAALPRARAGLRCCALAALA